MESGAVEGLIQSVFEGCLSMMETEIERRPYHRNCSCALHKKSRNGVGVGGGGSSKACSRCGKVTFPVRRSRSDGSLLSLAAAAASLSRTSSTSSSPAHGMMLGGGLHRSGSQLGLSLLEEEEND